MQSILGSGANSVCVSQSSSVLMPEQPDGKSEISQHGKEKMSSLYPGSMNRHKEDVSDLPK